MQSFAQSRTCARLLWYYGGVGRNRPLIRKAFCQLLRRGDLLLSGSDYLSIQPLVQSRIRGQDRNDLAEELGRRTDVAWIWLVMFDSGKSRFVFVVDSAKSGDLRRAKFARAIGVIEKEFFD